MVRCPGKYSRSNVQVKVDNGEASSGATLSFTTHNASGYREGCGRNYEVGLHREVNVGVSLSAGGGEEIR